MNKEQEQLVIQAEMLITHRFFSNFFKSRMAYINFIDSICQEIGLVGEEHRLIHDLDSISNPNRGFDIVVGLYIDGYRPNKLDCPLLNPKKYSRKYLSNVFSKKSKTKLEPIPFEHERWKNLLIYHEKIQTLITTERIIDGV